MMMNYENFSVHDFVKDEFFFKWVLHPHPDTDHFWRKWIENHPEKLDTINKARTFIEKVHYRDGFEMSDAAYTRIFENLMRYKKRQDISFKDREKFRRITVWALAAAAALMIFISPVLFNDKKVEELGIAQIEKEAPLGSKLTFVLPDGSNVKLNSGSKLTFPQEFAGDNREVYLEGEAFFDVVRNEAKPFVIHSGGLMTKVLGTSFNIRAGDEEVRVAVVTGLVEVTTAEGLSSLVKPDDMAVYTPKDQNLKVQVFNKLEELGWREGVLYFEKMSLKKVFETLETWYNVEIEVEDGLPLNELYSGEYHNENLENVLTGIGYTSGFDFVIEEKQVKIFKPQRKRL